VLDRVYMVEASTARNGWGHVKNTVALEEIVQIEESPLRLPAKWADELYLAPESGMGYRHFALQINDGSLLHFVVGNLVDFPNWPPGIGPENVVGVVTGPDREVFRHRGPGPYESGATFLWCTYES